MKNYRNLKNNLFRIGDYHAVPIRSEDRYLIMQWRNEQIYHLRQASPLTPASQDKYFSDVVEKLYDQNYPDQLLFSLLNNKNECIGYGGLVHINWLDKNAEISFIMKTELEQDLFHTLWSVWLEIIEEIAFRELQLHKLYVYAFDLRPHLYEVLKDSRYFHDATLKDHCYFDEKFIDVVIHSKLSK